MNMDIQDYDDVQKVRKMARAAEIRLMHEKKARQQAIIESLIVRGVSISKATKEAGVSRQAYYNWLEEDPSWKAKVELLKQDIVVKASETVYKAIETNEELAFKVLERRAPDQWAKTTKNVNINQASAIIDIANPFLADGDDIETDYVTEGEEQSADNTIPSDEETVSSIDDTDGFED